MKISAIDPNTPRLRLQGLQHLHVEPVDLSVAFGECLSVIRLRLDRLAPEVERKR